MKSVVIVIVIVCTLYVCGEKESNTCKTFADYKSRDRNRNCWYNPDVTATVPEMITRHGYPLEEYETVTKDKYILKVYRIPRKEDESKGVFFLQHPALLTSAVYVDLGNQSLAFYLWNEGYDVWMGNFRGTTYSPNHENISQEKQSNKYWNFSYHEFGIYDLPAFFDLCRKKTNYKHKIYYISHSVATSAALVYASLLVEHAEQNVQLLTLWSPMAFMGHEYSLAGIVAPFANVIMRIAEVIHVMYTPKYDGLIHHSIEDYCENWNMQFCYDVFQLLFGPDTSHVQPLLLELLLWKSKAIECKKIPCILLSRTEFSGNSVPYKILTHCKAQARLSFYNKYLRRLYSKAKNKKQEIFFKEWMPLAIFQTFAGFPLKAMIHNYQIMNAKGRFQYFDYGFIKNFEYYHSRDPPHYPVRNIRTPVCIVHGENDAMNPPEDAQYLYKQLHKDVRYGIRMIPGYAHMDFQYGKDIYEVLYKPTLNAIREMKIRRKESRLNFTIRKYLKA